MSRSIVRRVASRLRAARREEGQSIVFVAVCLIVFIGIVGLVVDVGNLHQVQRRLQVAADSAALAAATSLEPGSNISPSTMACYYSASAQTTGTCNGAVVATNCNGEPAALRVSPPNCNNVLAGYAVTTTSTLGCLYSADNGVGGCVANCNASGCPTGETPFSPACTDNCNAIRITESTSVAPLLMGALHFLSKTITATATASETGGIPQPLDVEMITDTTASMSNGDNCTITGISHPTQEDCAKQGIGDLLSILLPCDQGLSAAQCGNTVPTGGDNVTNPVDRVGLMVFPALDSTIVPGSSGATWLGAPDETTCNDDSVSGHVTYIPSTTTYNYSNYQVVPFSSDYRASDATTTLTSTSKLVNAIYWYQCPGGVWPQGGARGNPPAGEYGLEDPGGRGTYYGDVFNEANSAFKNNGRTGVHDAIVFLSDGNATACGTQTPGCSSGEKSYLSNTNDPTGLEECQSGIADAEAAETAGDLVFSIAYGALRSGSGNCASDIGYTTSSPTPDFSDASPMCTMIMLVDNKVTNPAYNGSDATALNTAINTYDCNSASGPNFCPGSATPCTSDPAFHFFDTPTGATLAGQFQSVGNALTSSRLVPDSAN